MKDYKIEQKSISRKDRELADLYLGGSDAIRGNGKRCYMHIYPRASERTAEVNAEKRLRKTEVRQYLNAKAALVQQSTGVNAEWVLKNSLREFAICIGDEPAIYEKMVRDPQTGEYNKVTHELRQFNPAGAAKALELIGRNIAVKAFQENVAVNHSFRLEELLNERMKKVEERAAKRKLELVD